MNTYKKKELLGIIASLEQINSTLPNNLGAGPQVICDMLAQCQEAAITVGNALEQHGDNGLAVISELECYCESLYQLSMSLEDTQKSFEWTHIIEQQLRQINQHISQVLPPDKKEIVFLPYKASMWDSLESVWKAARADDECETYVIPIPYFDRNPDGTLGEAHYEGNQYPEYVSITSWKKYNMAERKPDVIYIHNPYDHCNRVTTVHPDYYAAELCKHTNMLVYIPYFVAIDDKVEEHFCPLPGVMHAHKVIVQSEKVRQIYIDTIHKYERQNKCPGAFGNLEEKILALGSPKYDKVLTAKREDFEIPEEWERLIVRPDGSRKKVVLYNTTIEAMLKNSEMLSKIQSVFEIFQEREDVVLLWRPHPLLKSTLQSMRPALLAQYNVLETEYRKQKWGIYDNSSDLHRAIALSDAYYGDGSSVEELYRKTGKPIFIQWGARTFSGDMPVRAISPLGKKMYLVSDLMNGIFVMDLEKDRMEFLGRIPDEKMFGASLYCKSILQDEELVLVPFCADEIATMNILTKEVHKYRLPEVETKGIWKFSAACNYENTTYMIPGKFPYVIAYDNETHKVRVLERWQEAIPAELRKDDDMQLSATPVGVLGEKVFIQLIYTNALLVFNMQKEKFEETIRLPEGAYAFATAYEDAIWVIPTDGGEILRVSPENYEIAKVCQSPLRIQGDCPYASVRNINIHDKIYLLPQGAHAIGVIDTLNLKAESDTRIMEQLYARMGEYPMCSAALPIDGSKVLITACYKEQRAYQNLVIDLETMEILSEGLPLPENWTDICLFDYMKTHYQEKRVLNELDFSKTLGENPVKTFLNYIVKPEGNPVEGCQQETAGDRIHRNVRSKTC